MAVNYKPLLKKLLSRSSIRHPLFGTNKSSKQVSKRLDPHTWASHHTQQHKQQSTRHIKELFEPLFTLWLSLSLSLLSLRTLLFVTGYTSSPWWVCVCECYCMCVVCVWSSVPFSTAQQSKEEHPSSGVESLEWSHYLSIIYSLDSFN